MRVGDAQQRRLIEHPSQELETDRQILVKSTRNADPRQADEVGADREHISEIHLQRIVGLLAKAEFETEAAALSAELAGLKAETAELERHVTLLRPASLDPDMIDEEARRALNFIGPNEVVILP